MRWAAGGLIVLVAAAAIAHGRYRLPELAILPGTPAPVCDTSQGRLMVTLPGAALIATVAALEDEVYAYLTYDYLRSRRAFRRVQVLLTYKPGEEQPRYRVVLHLENDLTASLPLLARLGAEGYISDYEWGFVPLSELRRFQQQTRIFTFAYSLPVQRRLEKLSRHEVEEYVRKFVLFKSRTDPRVRRRIEPLPPVLTEEQAAHLAADILTVADFFRLPLEFFLGIGAMENNYMDVRGDLEHAVWKRRAEKGDIILRRRKGRVLVLNYATGVWQITRETLRYAHRLYRKSALPFAELPEHLLPPLDLNLDEISTPHLTTYAGLLFRDLLDRFDGDVAQAVGAYNGGPGNPNPAYEAGVRQVAAYARQVFEQAARLNGQTVTEMQFLAPPRRAQ